MYSVYMVIGKTLGYYKNQKHLSALATVNIVGQRGQTDVRLLVRNPI